MIDHSLSFLDLKSSSSGAPVARRLAALSFGALTYIVLAGTRPFQTELVAEFGRSGKGTSVEVLLYLATTCLCLLVCLHLAGRRLINWWMIGLAFLIGYCGLSLIWSDTAVTGIVRLGQLGLVSFAVASTVITLGVSRVLEVVYSVLLAILVLNFLSVMFVPFAHHQVGEIGTYPFNVSSWKGVHIHKNYAGPVAAMTVMMAVARVLSGRWWHVVVILAACVFLWNTKSTTSQIALGISLGLMMLSKLQCRAMGRGAARFTLLAIVASCVVVLPFLSGHFAALFNDPYALTGRVELWHALGSYIEAYPWTGSGFGSFWRIGNMSPILHITDGWAVHTGQGHNGVLDVAATIGLPGLALTLLLFLVLPSFTVVCKVRGRSANFDILFCFLVFAWFHNSVETSLLSPTHPVFFALLLATFGLGQLPSDPCTQEIGDV